MLDWSKDDWNTPTEILDRVRKVGDIWQDPCPNDASITRPRIDSNPHVDGLSYDWTNQGLVFVNPPFSRGMFYAWSVKVWEQARKGVEVVMVSPCNLETKAWTENLWNCDCICFPSHRIRFLAEGKETSPKGYAVVLYFGRFVDRFRGAFSDFGKIVETE